MDDEELEFRTKLSDLLQNNEPLEAVKEHFKQMPKDFDINTNISGSPDSRCDTILMGCLKSGTRPEVFKYLVEEQKADINKSISGIDTVIDGQKIPFAITEGKLKFNSDGINLKNAVGYCRSPKKLIKFLKIFLEKLFYPA